MPQQGSSQAQKMMRGMRELMQRQQQLLDRSFRAQQQAQQGRMGQQGQQGDQQDSSAQMGDAAGQQEGLRRMLGEGKMRPGVVVIGGIRRKNPARVTDFQFWPSIPTRLMGISAGIIG